MRIYKIYKNAHLTSNDNVWKWFKYIILKINF
jgi:hypothetical protein